MANSVLSAPQFQDENAAFEYVEAHLWPRGPVCPHCGERKKIGRLQGATTRAGLRKCYVCRKPFTVRIGSIFEDSKLALHLWLQVIHLMCASKKGISTRQVQRMLQCSMKTAWHLTHRIRHAMADGGMGPLGGAGKVVEVDETYFGNLPPEKAPLRNSRTGRIAQGPSFKRGILSLVERGGEVRSFYVEGTKSEDVARIVRQHVAKESRLHTDEHRMYLGVGKEFASHERVNHSKKEYARGDVTTNTVESFFSVFKRGMRGVYQQCGEQHLHRYVAEFDFRHNARQSLGVTDQQRTARAVMGAKGKRLTYQTIGRA
ncbi:MAG: IS1595 family transposase [Reyranella sp.]|nr:IS1595 family transposase [Reyranella sp.]